MAKKPTYEELEQRVKELEQVESERKHAEVELQKRETTIQSVFDAAPVGICIMENRVYQRVNRGWCESFGYPEENLIGRTTEFLYESYEEYERVGKELLNNLHKKGMAFARTRLKRSDGEFRDVDLIAKPLNPYDIESDSVVVVVHDITDRMKAEKALKESEEKFRYLVKNSNDMFVIIDENAKELFVSDSVERITGLTPAETMGHSGFEFLHPDDVDHVSETLSKLLQTPGGTIRDEYRHRRKDGGWVYLEAMGTNYLHEPLVGGIVLNVRDITERKRIEEKLDIQYLSSIE